MIWKNNTEWLNRQISDWAAKGWISAEAEQNIRQSCRRQGVTGWPALVYTALAIVTCSILGVALIWGAAYVWYHISVALRMALAVVLLVLSQSGVALALFQNRQGTLLGEGVALAQCVAVFVSIAMAGQTFYLGWDTPAYIFTCAVLSLPAAYLLRAVGAVVVYCLAVLVWAALGGYINAPGGAAFFWLFVVLPLPMYRLLVQQKDEVRLSVFSWTVTVTVFAAFGLATRNAAYIPFLLLSALAAVIMLTGYSIDIRKSWGVPFRWFGRFAAAASLLISCMPVSWYGVADIQGFHWTTMTILFLLFLLIIALLARGVKTRLWGPVIYSFIPFILLGETLIVRSGLYSSVPLIISAAYMIFLGFYEIMQGVKGGHVNHTRFGTVMLACLMLVFVFATTFSPVVPLVVMAILGLIFFQRRRTASSRKSAELRAARRSRVKHTAATVRRETGEAKPDGGESAPVFESPQEAKDAAADADTLAEWMKDIHLPPLEDLTPEPADTGYRPAGTVTPKEAPQSQFVPPVFRSPDAIALPTMKEEGRTRKKADEPRPAERITSSPWQSMAGPAKREKHFSRSPWSQEGDTKK